MVKSVAKIPLTEFLSQPNIEASPAWELINGEALQKPMPTLFHSRLQRNLVNYINNNTEQFEAIQELRCIVPPLSPVPDISVIACKRICDEDGAFEGAPDWLIEIRSPGQSTIDLQNKILHCLSNGTQLAWLIDINRQQIWVWVGDELPVVFSGEDILPTLGNLPLTVNAVMGAVQVDDLRWALLQHKPNIVHFCGHGAGDDGLILENENEQRQFVSSESLAGLFKLCKDDVECVVMNACYSEVQAEAIHQHINCVIGMNKAIGDKAAIKFATGFYQGLFNARNYQDSFELGKNALDLESIPESQTPQIKIRDSSKSLISLDSKNFGVG